jgi:hypothetical protein
VAPDITADQAAEATDHPDVSDDVIVDVALEVASDIAPEVVDEPVETVPDPMVSPDVPVTEWKGKLSPGSMVSKEMVGFRPTADPPSGELYPLVVFARDHQAQKDSYKKTMKHIAQFGYVTASVDYDLGLLDPDHHAPVENLKRAIDVLTTKPPDNVGNVVDPKRIAAMGHAVGGKAAVWLALEDPRVSAVITLSPVDDDPGSLVGSSHRPSLAPEQMGKFKVPALFLGAALGSSSNSCAPSASNACRFFESVPDKTTAWLGVLEAFGHLQFIDDYDCLLLCGSCPRGPKAEHEKRQLVFRGLSVAFLQLQFRHASGYLSWLEGTERTSLETANFLLDTAEQGNFCKP